MTDTDLKQIEWWVFSQNYFLVIYDRHRIKTNIMVNIFS